MAVALDDNIQTAALPLHVQRLRQLLNISPLLNHVEEFFSDFENDRIKRYILK